MNKINGRTPEEIREGLRCDETGDCTNTICPYFPEKDCLHSRHFDFLTLINQLQEDKKQLEAERDQYKRERDAAVKSLRGWCEVCVHWESEDSIAFCDGCTHNYPFEHETNFSDRWQWRGLQEDSNGAE